MTNVSLKYRCQELLMQPLILTLISTHVTVCHELLSDRVIDNIRSTKAFPQKSIVTTYKSCKKAYLILCLWMYNQFSSFYGESVGKMTKFFYTVYLRVQQLKGIDKVWPYLT